jgi:TonB family protein
MKRLGRVFAYMLGSVVLVPSFLEGQQAKQLPASEVEQHIVKRVTPNYPQMASLAHIQGKVVIDVTIGPDGNVAQLHAVSGHPMLVQAALEAVRWWKYRPFEDKGAPVAVQSQVRVLFAMGPDAPLQQKYFLEEGACHDMLQLQRFDAAYKFCNAALGYSKGAKARRIWAQDRSLRQCWSGCLPIEPPS